MAVSSYSRIYDSLKQLGHSSISDSAIMVCYAFAVRRGQDILLEVPMPVSGTSCQAAEHSHEPATFGHRMVFGFFQGQFTQMEVESFMQDLAQTTGTALAAPDHFEAYDADSKVSTGGITFQNPIHIPHNILAIMEEYRYVKYITERSFQNLQVEWFESLKALQPVQLP